MTKKQQVKNDRLKKRIIIATVGIIAAIAILLGGVYACAVNLPHYLETRMRCNASSIVTGFETPLRHEKRYYPEGDEHNTGAPGIWDRYFCSNKEAEDAGYQVYTDLRVR